MRFVTEAQHLFTPISFNPKANPNLEQTKPKTSLIYLVPAQSFGSKFRILPKMVLEVLIINGPVPSRHLELNLTELWTMDMYILNLGRKLSSPQNPQKN